MSKEGQTDSSALSLNDLLRLLTSACKIPLADALQAASALMKSGLSSKELIGAKPLEELGSICSQLNEQQVHKLHNTCLASKRKRKTEGEAALPKRGRKYTVKDKDSPINDAALELPITLDEEVIAKTVVVVNRAPLMMLFAACVLRHTCPTYKSGSHLSLASATAAAASRRKAISIGLARGDAGVEHEVSLEGYRTLVTFGTIEIPVLLRGDAEGYWGIDVDAMEKQAAKGVPDPEIKWIHPTQVHSYLVRAFGKDLAAVNGAIELLIRSWESTESWASRAWNWYVGVRPDIAYGKEGWGQRGSVSCSDILKYRRNNDD